jgi:hypothetical protein
MKRIPAVLLVLLLSAPASAFAWGPIGHRIVGRIAQNHLAPEAARAIECLMGPESLARASTWPDEIRSDPAWKKAEPWHYIDIDDGETLETTARAPEGDVLEAMERFEKVLRDPQAGRQAKVEALRFLVHFVGDVHQPLHVGRRADQGGNLTQVTFFKEAVNLHTVWDSSLIENQKLSYTEYADFLDHPTQEEVRTWQASTYRDWIQESFAARAQVYDLGDGKLSFPYVFKNTPLVERRLLQAGVRLAGLLDSIFAQPPAPVQP